MKKLALVFSVLLLCAFVPPQNPNPFALVQGIKTNAKLIHTDNFGNLYVVTKTNQLTKYGRQGTVISTLNYNNAGNITQIDASNPMQIYLFYRELNKVVMLDNNLAYRGEINLTKAGIIQASAIARSYDNNVWVFDLGDLQLKKVSTQNEVEQTSGNIRQYIIDNAAVTHLFDNGERLFMVDSTNGILLFDVFASYQKTIPLKGIAEIKILDKYFFYYANQKLNKYNWQTGQSNSYNMPDTTNVIKLSVEKERLYLQKPDSVYLYSY